MKKKINVLILLFTAFTITGCISNMSPKEKTEDFLNKYIKNDSEIIKEVDEYLDQQELTGKQKDRYKKIIREEYSTLKYKIKSETVLDDVASVEVDVTVTDLYSANQTANNNLLDNPSDFYVNGIYSSEKFIDHKLDIMENTKDKISYTLTFKYEKENGSWVLVQPSDESLEKIHGIYKY